MKRILGDIRRADQDFHMIQPGDSVAVGVSGGKDSLLLVEALARYREFAPNSFTLSAITIATGLEPFDLSGVEEMCNRLRVPYHIVPTQIGKIVFEERKEANPCALCAKMRRGALANACKEYGINKLALGHHRDDAIETLLMSLLFEGRFHTFQPVTHLERTEITQIRPLIYTGEKQILSLVKKLNLPVVQSPCPVNHLTRREDMKHLMDELCKKYPNARAQILSALKNEAQYGLWTHENPKT